MSGYSKVEWDAVGRLKSSSRQRLANSSDGSKRRYFEASLMKKKLSLDTFTNAIKTYVYDLNELSSLGVIAYIREATADTDVFHLFGRTRTFPHTFYYRTLTIVKADTSNVMWRPWTKIDIDLPSVETEWEGKRLDVTGTHLIPLQLGGRLYLFIPQILPRSVERDKASSLGSQKFSEINDTYTNATEPKRVWEITMAWTELVRGAWSPKRVSTGSLLLDNSSCSKPNALRFEPKFEPELSSSKITIVVGYPDRATSENSTFHQDTTTDLGTLVSKVISDGTDDKPLHWLPGALVKLDASAEKSKKAKSISWTLSYSREGPTSLVLSTQRADGTGVTYFNVPKRSLGRLRDWSEKELNDDMDLVALDHAFSHNLMSSAASRVDPLNKVFHTLTTQSVANLPWTFGEYTSAAEREVAKPGTAETAEEDTLGPVYHELAQPTALYNWEIGLHSVLLAMDRLAATQQFDEALQVARLVFDPTIDVELERYVAGSTGSNKATEKKQSCWRFPPFQDIAQRLDHKRDVNLKLLDIDNDKDFNLAIMERRTHGALVHATARGRPEAYMKWVVMKYAEILISAGDVQFTRGTLESLPLAIQRYIEASHILGPEPTKIPKLGTKQPRSYDYLEDEDVRLQLSLPWSAKLQAAPEISPASSDDDSMVCYLRTTYFCVPLNPKFKQMRSLLHERLYNIRNWFDIQGRPISYALPEPSIDPGALIALGSQGLSMSQAMAAPSICATNCVGEQLYAWMEKNIRNTCYQAYTMALDAARKAETALSFEQGQSLTLLRPGGYWDAAHDALLSADHLLLDLKRLESAYLDSKHDFEIIKTTSLRQVDPLALLNIRIKGKATFSLTENLFDTDFPGHYMRRIKSVAVTIPAIVGPYVGINASLHLTDHRYRISSTVSKQADYAAQNRESFRTDKIPISAVAISSGTQDPGVFELAFTGPKYMPFEGAGAISSWRLELPEVRKFDYESISDIIMHIQYTALDGGFTLRSVAGETVRKMAEANATHGCEEGFWAMWDLKNDFINEWYGFSSQLLTAKSKDAQASASSKAVTMRLGNLMDRLPYSARQQPKLCVRNIIWVSRSKAMVTEIGMNGVPTPGEEDRVIEGLGECTMKSWKNLYKVEKLDDWEATAPGTVVGEGDESVPNVYMLIRYTYGPSKS
ncbi:hypothetical protein F66182_818 [Fusarium sp. NRRL 66182]|nr:hypothetical protein F66182_818 [Fusarium sp. NRRL 66182]